MSLQCTSISLYADDILLVAPSVQMLQEMLNCCETEIMWLDMRINANKIGFYQIQSSYDTDCFQIVTANGNIIEWANSIRYLGFYFVSVLFFKCNWDHAKSSYYRSFNDIFGRIGRFASVETVMYLIKSKFIPVLIYGIEACPTHSSYIKTLDHPIIATFLKVFKNKSAIVNRDFQMAFGFRGLHEQILTRNINFLNSYQLSKLNKFCHLSKLC